MTNKAASVDVGRIAEIAQPLLRLSPEQLRALANLCVRLPDTAHLTADALQRELGLATADAIGIVRSVSRTQASDSLADLAIVATACAETQSAQRSAAEKVDVVCTGPVQFTVPVRATFATMIEMVEQARREIAIVGYVFTKGAAEFVRRVAEARQRGASVTILGNSMQKGLHSLKQLWGLGPAPAVYSWEDNGKDEMTSLHAKLLICDKNTALVTSANYSLHGLHENVEIGLRVCSPSVTRLNDFVKQLIASPTVQPMSW